MAAKDIDALMALYDPAVRVFDLWGRWSFEGRAAWRAAVEEWFGSLGEESVRVELADVLEAGGEGVAVVTGFVRYANTGPDEAEQRAMHNRKR